MAFARAKTTSRMTSSFKTTSRVFEYQNTAKCGIFLEGNLSRKPLQPKVQYPGNAWESLMAKTDKQEKPVPKTQAFVFKQQEQKSARTLRPDLQDPIIAKPAVQRHVREKSAGGMTGLLVKSNDCSKITQCQRKHSARTYEHSVQFSYPEEQSRDGKSGIQLSGYFTASKLFQAESPRIGAEKSVQIKDPQAQNAKRPSAIVKHLKDFRSAIETLPGSVTSRGEGGEKPLGGIQRERLGRNLLTTYEITGMGVTFEINEEK